MKRIRKAKEHRLEHNFFQISILPFLLCVPLIGKQFLAAQGPVSREREVASSASK